MRATPQPSRFHQALVFLCAAAATRLPPLALPPSRQLGLMPDDACYYLESARRVLEGANWPTLDGLHATNGFHPLYMGVLLALEAVIGTSPARLVPAVLLFHLAANTLAAWMLFTRTVPAGSRAAVPVAALLGLSAGWWSHGLAGLENALVAPLLLVLAARWCARLDALDATESRARTWVADGVLAGFAMLARTDAVIFVGVGMAAIAVFRAPRLGPARVARELAFVALPAVLLVSPWLFANLARFGTISQDSGAALLLRHERLVAPFLAAPWWGFRGMHLGFWALRLGALWGAMPLTFFLLGSVLPGKRHRSRPPEWWPWVALALGAPAVAIGGQTLWGIEQPARAGAVLALSIVALAAGAWTAPRPARPSTFLLLAWLAAMAIAYAFVLGHFQAWYTTAPALAGIGLLTVPPLVRLLESRRWLAVALVVMIGADAALTWQRLTSDSAAGTSHADTFPYAARCRQAFEQLAITEPGTRVGSFDCGQLAFLVHPFPVVNLDGVMNHEVVQALQARSLDAFLERERIGVLLSPASRIAEYQALSPFRVRPDSSLTRAFGLDAARVVP